MNILPVYLLLYSNKAKPPIKMSKLTPLFGEIASPVRAPAPAVGQTTPPRPERPAVCPSAPRRPLRPHRDDRLPLVTPILLRQYAQDGLDRPRG